MNFTFSFSGLPMRELQAIRTLKPKEANLTPAEVTGGLQVIISSRQATSSSDNFKPAIPLSAVYNLNIAEARTTTC